jgi:hypothetical protein
LRLRNFTERRVVACHRILRGRQAVPAVAVARSVNRGVESFGGGLRKAGRAVIGFLR